MVTCPNCGFTGCRPGQFMRPQCFSNLPSYSPDPVAPGPATPSDEPEPPPRPKWPPSGDSQTLAGKTHSAVVEPPPVPKPLPPGTVTCPKCGYLGIQPEHSKCPQCSSELQTPTNRTDSPVAREDSPPPRRMICPSCKASVVVGTEFCDECGNPLVKDGPTPPPPALNVCPKCGSATGPGAKFCSKCRHPLTIRRSPNPATTDRSSPASTEARRPIDSPRRLPCDPGCRRGGGRPVSTQGRRQPDWSSRAGLEGPFSRRRSRESGQGVRAGHQQEPRSAPHVIRRIEAYRHRLNQLYLRG